MWFFQWYDVALVLAAGKLIHKTWPVFSPEDRDFNINVFDMLKFHCVAISLANSVLIITLQRWHKIVITQMGHNSSCMCM